MELHCNLINSRGDFHAFKNKRGVKKAVLFIPFHDKLTNLKAGARSKQVIVIYKKLIELKFPKHAENNCKSFCNACKVYYKILVDKTKNK